MSKQFRFSFRRVVTLVMAGILLTPLLSGFSSAPSVPLDTLPLLDQTSMQYLGSFAAPEQDGNGTFLTYGGNALSYDPTRQGLFIGCHDYTQYLAEISVPAITDPPQMATFLQNCADVTEGRLPLVDDYLPRLGGTFLYNGRLIVSAYGSYDADWTQTASHFASTPDLALAGDIAGPFTVGSGQPGAVGGYMTPIPAEWRSAFGGPALTGHCCHNIVSRSSSGPSVSVFDPNDVGVVNPVPAETVLLYPVEHPLATPDSQNDIFNLTTRIGGVAFPAGTRSVLFFGRHGAGPYCYESAEICGGDPADPYKGSHAFPYYYQVWAYDALDLLAVKNGTMQSWEVQPYAFWRLPEMVSIPGHASISGAAYDPASGRLYITEEYGATPHVHVYQITVANDVTPPTVVSSTRANADPTNAASVDFTVAFSESVTGVDAGDFSLTTSGVSGATVSGFAGTGAVYTLTVSTGTGNGTLRLDLPASATISDLNGNPLDGLPFTGGESYAVTKTAPVLYLPQDAAILAYNRPAFDWSDFPGATSYQIQVSKDNTFKTTVLSKTSATSSYATTSNLPTKTLLYWRVRAKVGGVYGAWSEIFSFTSANPPSAPSLSAPANNALVAGPSPLFDWKDSTVPSGVTFDHYQIQIATDSVFTAIVHNHNISGATNSLDNDAVLNPATTYYWRVRSYALNGDYSAWSTARSVKIKFLTPALLGPADLSTVGSLKPVFTWNVVVGATTYTIQISKRNTFGLGTTSANVAAPTYTPGANLSSQTTYYWRVKVNGLYGPSDWSLVFSFTTP
jgi:hypothetical protein